MNLRKTTMIAIAIAGLTAATSASAVPWCHGGTIVTVADVQWNHADLLYQTQNITAPPNVYNEDYYLAWTAGSNYCQSYAGGAGPNLGVPGNGSVNFVPYAPFSFTNTLSYQLHGGLSFECEKCYAIPPMRRAREVLFPINP